MSPFTRLARTHALAMAGDTLVTLALAGSLFFSISPTAARGRVMLSLLLTMAPFAVVAPLLGPAIDRSRRGRRFTVVATAAGRSLLCLAMVRVIDSLLLFPVAFALLVLSKTYSVTKSALVPSVVSDDDELVEANAKLSVLGVVAGFVAAAPGVLLLRVFDARWTLRLGALAFVGAAIAALALPARPPAEPTGEPSSPSTPKLGARVHVAAAATALLRALVGFLTFLVAFGFRRASAPAWWFGVVLASSMAATLAAGALAPVLRRTLREERIIELGLALVAGAALVAARMDGALWAAPVAAAVGLGAAGGRLAFDAIVQRDANEAVHGRSFATFETGFQLVWVVGALLPVVVATPLGRGFDVLAIAAGLGAVAYAAADRRLGVSPPPDAPEGPAAREG